MSFACLTTWHHYEVQIELEHALRVAHQGDCDSDATEVANEINGLGIPRDGMIEGLEEYGAWEREQLEAKTDRELESIIVWLVGNDVREAINQATTEHSYYE
tara:strand:+ start:223 stop:528 length:306 start_codon:yes stop_codon:yes gene_type:complete